MAPVSGSSRAMATISRLGFRLRWAVTALPARSFLIDGEAIVTNRDGPAVFDLVCHKRHGGDAVQIAFDLIELDGDDLRRSP